jgi:hypothetical protein
MATGDDAVAAGMDIVPGTALANTIDTEINKTRDYIAQRTAAVTPLEKGGTGSTTAAAARTALGITASNIPMGGGGNVEAAINARLVKTQTEYGNDFAYRDAQIGSKLPLTGGTVTGHIWIPNSSPADSGYTVAYINGDGRISRGASSRRYKTDITDAPDMGDLFAMPLREYRMRQDGPEPPTTPVDSVPRIGYIAEELLDTAAARFVVWRDGEVESIDFIALLMAQNVQLHEENGIAAQRIAQMEDRIARLEAGA